MQYDRSAAPRRAYLAHGIPKVSVLLREELDGSIVFDATAYRFRTSTGDPYEYKITVAAKFLDAVRMALSAQPQQDAFDAIRAHAAEIMQQGEAAWLKSHDIPYELDSWAPWVEIDEKR